MILVPAATIPSSRGYAAAATGPRAPSGVGLPRRAERDAIAYAARDGTTALDGEANSPYLEALVKHLAEPGLEINLLFRKVRDDVLAKTGRQQEPITYGSLPAQPLFFRR